METDDIKNMIESGIPGSQVAVSGDGSHFQARVVCDVFTGMTKVQQHQLVYKTLGDKVGNEIHALTIETYTSGEWEMKKQLRVF